MLKWKGKWSVFDPSKAKELVIEIQFGEGGNDSKSFVAELATTYIKYAQKLNIECKTLDASEGHVLLKFSSANVWQAFKNESGKHVVQRVPPTENKGRRHTSIISVAVLPILDLPYALLKRDEIEIKTQGGHGAGGQHQNTTDSAVRMTHISTGISVFINGRKQNQNKKEALKILTARVNDFYLTKIKSAHSELRYKQMGGGSRSGKIRTYDFVNSRVTDHNLKLKTRQLETFMKGSFDVLFDKK